MNAMLILHNELMNGILLNLIQRNRKFMTGSFFFICHLEKSSRCAFRKRDIKTSHPAANKNITTLRI